MNKNKNCRPCCTYGTNNNVQSSTCRCVGSAGPDGATGATGNTGLNPYQIAVENGFVGTEQQWLDSLVGPTGPQSVSGSIIPYNAYELSLTYDGEPTEQHFNIYAIPFGGEGTMISASNFPYTISSFPEEDGAIIAFTTTSETTITAISAEFIGEAFAGENVNFSVHAALYESAPLLSTFTYIPLSDVQLFPSFNVEQTDYIASGINNFSYTVSAGTKLALIVYLISDETPTVSIGADVSGVFFGGVSLKEV